MTGNVWQFVNDWYGRNYYSYSLKDNPPGPASGSIMPDGKPYRGMRGGNWYNGENGHGRVSNRNPSYFRGPQDPDHPYYHLGFRVVLPVNAESRPAIKPTPVQQSRGRDGGKAGDARPPRAPAQPAGGTPTGGSINKPTATFVLRSSAVADGGALPAEFTGDGAAATLPLEWTGAPEATKCYAIIMHHEAPDMTKWYWILYNIPAATHNLPKNAKGIGTLGNNCVTRRQEYAPPHSKGPGAKTYIYTVYALPAPLHINTPPAEVDRNTLLAAMKDNVLATAELRVTYTRPDGAMDRENRGTRRGPPGDPPGRQDPESR